jgi:hypothetical protein
MIPGSRYWWPVSMRRPPAASGSWLRGDLNMASRMDLAQATAPLLQRLMFNRRVDTSELLFDPDL